LRLLQVMIRQITRNSKMLLGSGGVQKLPPLSVKKPYLVNNSFSQSEKIFPVLEDKNEEMKNSPTLQLSRERIVIKSLNKILNGK